MRIRRTALIHKLGQRRQLEPGADGMSAQLRLVRHPAEQLGELGFDGPTIWLESGAETMQVEGPIIQMDSVRFDTVDRAGVRVLIQRDAHCWRRLLLADGKTAQHVGCCQRADQLGTVGWTAVALQELRPNGGFASLLAVD